MATYRYVLSGFDKCEQFVVINKNLVVINKSQMFYLFPALQRMQQQHEEMSRATAAASGGKSGRERELERERARAQDDR